MTFQKISRKSKLFFAYAYKILLATAPYETTLLAPTGQTAPRRAMAPFTGHLLGHTAPARAIAPLTGHLLGQTAPRRAMAPLIGHLLGHLAPKTATAPLIGHTKLIFIDWFDLKFRNF